MKYIVAIIVAAVFTASVTYVALSGTHKSDLAKLQDAHNKTLEDEKRKSRLNKLQNQRTQDSDSNADMINALKDDLFKTREDLDRALANALPKTEVLTTAVELIKTMEKQPLRGVSTQRKMVHYLESLSDLGPEALPAMREYLNASRDKVLLLPDTEEE